MSDTDTQAPRDPSRARAREAAERAAAEQNGEQTTPDLDRLATLDRPKTCPTKTAPRSTL